MDTRIADQELFQLAKQTVASINGRTGWIPESGAQMAWIAAVRLGWNATDFVLAAGGALAAGGQYPSLYGIDGGGGLETTGMTLAVNEMLLQSHERGLRFFPVWDPARPVSFTTLRTVGAFLVSGRLSPAAATAAAATNAVVHAEIVSEVGEVCTIYGSSGGRPRVVVSGSEVPVAIVFSTDKPFSFSFNTTAGTVYALAMTYEGIL